MPLAVLPKEGGVLPSSLSSVRKYVFAGNVFCGLVLGKPGGIHVFIFLLYELHIMT